MKYFMALALLFVFVSCGKNEKPIDKPEFEIITGSSIPEFEGNSAYDYVAKQLSFGSRNPNSSGHAQAQQFLFNELKKYADSVELQEFTYNGYEGEQLNLCNIMGHFNPKYEKHILLCAHWDSRPNADEEMDEIDKIKPVPGANDGASGVAVLLELAKIINEKPLPFGVDILLLDGEDYGRKDDLDNFCLGSKYFAATKSRDYKPVFGILLDMVGDKEAVFLKDQASLAYAPEILNLVWGVAETIGAKSFSSKNDFGIYDDHIPLNKAGIRTIDIIDSGIMEKAEKGSRRDYWHTLKDDMRNISAETLDEVGGVLTHLLYSLKIN